MWEDSLVRSAAPFERSSNSKWAAQPIFQETEKGATRSAAPSNEVRIKMAAQPVFQETEKGATRSAAPFERSAAQCTTGQKKLIML